MNLAKKRKVCDSESVEICNPIKKLLLSKLHKSQSDYTQDQITLLTKHVRETDNILEEFLNS